MNKPEVIEVMSLIKVHWPNWRVPTDPDKLEFLIASWVRMLADIEHVVAVAAIERFLGEDRDFPPNVGQLRRRAMDMTSPSPLPDVDDAWAEVRGEVNRVGTKRGMLDFGTDAIIECRWSHPAVGEAAEAMGWQYLCNSTDEMADRAHFIRFFAAARERAEDQRVMPPSVRTLMAASREAIAMPSVVAELAEARRLPDE